MGALLARLCRFFGLKCGNVRYVYEYLYEEVPEEEPLSPAVEHPHAAPRLTKKITGVKQVRVEEVEPPPLPPSQGESAAAATTTVVACMASIFTLLLPHVGGLAAMLITRKEAVEWYDQQLRRPRWMLKSHWLTPLVAAAYSACGLGTFLVCLAVNDSERLGLALGLHCTHILLSWTWPPIFYNLKNMRWATTHASAACATAACCGYSYWTIDHHAGYLLIPFVVLHAYMAAEAFWILKHPKQSKAKPVPFWGCYYQTLMYGYSGCTIGL